MTCILVFKKIETLKILLYINAALQIFKLTFYLDGNTTHFKTNSFDWIGLILKSKFNNLRQNS